MSYSTIHSIGIEWGISGDANHNATVNVHYQVQGRRAWKAALLLVRVDNAYNGNGFAGSIFFLHPDTTYKVRLELSDPDGGAFAVVALLLAALGLYGLLAYSVAWRIREIRVRVALGALPRDVAYLFLREGIGLTVGGIAIGLLIALASTRVLQSMLYGVRATDSLTLAGVAVLLFSVAVLACALPVRRALGVDPAAALRHE